MPDISLESFHAAAMRVVARADQAALAAEQAKSAGGDWQALHIASHKARTARAVADAIAEISAES